MQRIASPSTSFCSSLSTIIISSNLALINHPNFTHRILNTSVNTFIRQNVRVYPSRIYITLVHGIYLILIALINFVRKRPWPFLTIDPFQSVLHIISVNWLPALPQHSWNMPILFLCEKKNTNTVYKVVRILYTAYTPYKILQTLYTA